MRNRVLSIWFVLLIIILLKGNLFSQINDEKSLLSIKGIKVINFVFSTSNATGINNDRIIMDCELKLRNVGLNVIKTVGIQDSVKIENVLSLIRKEERPYIFVNLKVLSNFFCQTKNWIISLDVYQEINIKPNYKIFVSTWHSDNYGMISEDSIFNLRDRANDLLDEFLIDYLKANPKK